LHFVYASETGHRLLVISSAPRQLSTLRRIPNQLDRSSLIARLDHFADQAYMAPTVDQLKNGDLLNPSVENGRKGQLAAGGLFLGHYPRTNLTSLSPFSFSSSLGKHNSTHFRANRLQVITATFPALVQVFDIQHGRQ
jgi:hypothetical protein